jgi:hypothetical protein
VRARERERESERERDREREREREVVNTFDLCNMGFGGVCGGVGIVAPSYR